MSGTQSKERQLNDEVIARRRDEVIKRMLNTPPQPRKAKHKPDEAKERPSRKARSKRPS